MAAGAPIRPEIESAGRRGSPTPANCRRPAFLASAPPPPPLALNDPGDPVRLLEPGGRVVDKIAYLKVRAYNLSYGRLPDGGHHLFYGLWPTGGRPNVLF